jgi:N-methylhydantoinase A
MSSSAPEQTGQILAVDVGGTFTDATLIDLESGALTRTKVATTPEQQSDGVLQTFAELAVDAGSLRLFCHGTTVGLNAFLQRAGAKTGLICTEGTRDMLDVARMRRDNHEGLYDVHWKRPQQARPVVHRRFIREVPGRMLYDGREYIELDEEAVRREVEFLRDEGIESIAICLMNSYANLAHEERILALIRELIPGAYVQSSAFRPVVGEYARTAGTVVDAYTGPIVSSYLRRLRERMSGAGYDTTAVIMQMSGGVRTLERTIESFPAFTLESGPVAGMLGAEYYGRHFVGSRNLVCIDIGGTSTDIGLVVDGVAATTDEWEIEWGFTLGVPAIDVRSIGAGGGSLIQVDEMGTLRIGPESAGSQPGPACYGRGGTRPTITDAHVVTGAVRGDAFLGGRMTLDLDAAKTAVESVASRLGMSRARLASEAVHLMNAGIEAEISHMVFERGMDVRDFALFAYGGAGALHAAEVARLAGIREVIIPQAAGGFSTIGMITAPPKVEQSVSSVAELSQLDPANVRELFAGLETTVLDDLGSQGVDAANVEIRRSIYGMYSGQSFSNELELASWPLDADALAAWRVSFDEMYDRLYGYSAPELDVTVTTLRVVGTGPRIQLRLPRLASAGTEAPTQALAGVEQMPLGEDFATREVSVYKRSELLAGNELPGPVVIEDEATTIFVPEHSTAHVDEYGNVRIELEEVAR